MSAPVNRRILLIDDMPSIHEDFRKILPGSTGGGSSGSDLADLEAAVFGAAPRVAETVFELHSAFQGQEGLAEVELALREGRPYAMAFVDMRMPPGWDGVQTIERLWQADPSLQVVICTALSDHSWDEVFARLDLRDRLLILKKPFDAIEVLQLASALTVKWQMAQDAALKMSGLEDAIRERTRELRDANEALQLDIVQRTRNEAELKLAASVFHNTMDGVMILDPARRIVSINPAFTDITGFGTEQVLGLSADMLRCERQGLEFYTEMRHTLEREGRWCGELWNQRRSGEPFLAWLNIVMVPGPDGQPERYVSVFHDITELRRTEERIRHLAFHDALTGLPNQALLHDRLEQAISAARRDGSRLGVMFVDLDRFKAVNDSFGHDTGNALLKALAERLRASVRESDTVARMGGDEFVVLLRDVEETTDFGLVAQKVIACLSMPVKLEEHAVQVGASIGIACFPEDGPGMVDLMKHADAAMYSAKDAGRGTYRFFQPSMTDKAVQRLQLEMQLRSAPQNGELELFYQPQVSLESGALRGMEALVRWRHPQLGLLPPGEFIALAETTGIINEIGDWVLQEACRQSRAWFLQGLGRIRISVNVSARQLQRPDFVDRVLQLATQYEVSPADLEIELTESVLMGNPQETSNVLGRLREAGLVIAVDDFGTGYSSLAYLRRLPIDVLKIDRSFVMNVDSDEGDAQVVKLVLAFGQALHLDIVAEGVETPSQAQFLRDCGCKTAQGYLYSKPQPAAQIEPWLRGRAPQG